MLEARSTLTAGGRVLIPIAIRRLVHIEEGEELILTAKGGEIHIKPMKKAIREVQQLVKKYNKKDLSLTDALIAERREESDRE